MRIGASTMPALANYPGALGAAARPGWPRLPVACALSLLVHMTLLAGIPVNPTGGLPNVVSMITARLEPAAAPAADVDTAMLESLPPTGSVSPLPAEIPASALARNRQGLSEPQTDARSESPRTTDAPSSPSSGLDVPLIRDPTYYTVKQLDVYPQPLAPIRLDYPDAAANARIDGRLTVLLLIDEFGVVNDVAVTDADPRGYFEDAAMATFRTARFAPAQKQGHAVKSRITLQVKYLYGDSVAAR